MSDVGGGGTGGLVEQVSLSEGEGLSHACVLGGRGAPGRGDGSHPDPERVPSSCVCGGVSLV